MTPPVYPLSVSSWAGDPRGTALLFTRDSMLQYMRLGRFQGVDDVELGKDVARGIAEENTPKPDFNEDIVVLKGMRAVGMSMMDYLEELGLVEKEEAWQQRG